MMCWLTHCIYSASCWNAEETGSTNERIGLGDSARTFTAKQDVSASHEPLSSAVPLQPPYQATTTHHNHRAPGALPSAVPLQPPYQATTTPHNHKAPGALPAPGLLPHAVASAVSSSNSLSHGPQEHQAGSVTPQPAPEAVVTNGHPSCSQVPSPALSSRSESSQHRISKVEQVETLEPTSGGTRRVLFHAQPDVLILTLPEEADPTVNSPPDIEEEEMEEDVSLSLGRGRSTAGAVCLEEEEGDDDEEEEEALSYRRRKNKAAEKELHHMSEKLSRRLEDLHQMLQRVLGESGGSSQLTEDDQQSHHGDGYTHTDTPRPQTKQRTLPCSLSPSQARVEPEGPTRGSTRGHGPRPQTNPQSAPTSTRGYGRERRACQQLLYEEELRRYEAREEARLAQERLRAQEAEREYREAILRDLPQTPRLSHGQRERKKMTVAQPRSLPSRPSTTRRRQDHPRKAPPMKVKENDLLPVLLQEFPLLQLSPHSLAHMWQQQMGQVDRLHGLSASTSQRQRRKLGSQVEDTQRRQDLLVEIIRKEREHNKRLRDFKERIQQQKAARNRLKEQRQQVTRAKKYHSSYHVQLRARLTRARSKEEKMLREVFSEGLALQKARLNEERSYARENRLEQKKRHLDHISSMENYYRDQFSLLAETLAEERQEIQVHKKAQEKALMKLKRELRSRMEREIGQLQSVIIQNDQDDFFQDLEVQRLRKRIQMASFQYNSSGLR
ncbi:Centrosomal protein [Merluccius polli]|uniref:Centrosomal protein n=1 Tax=Merluccius polli TaxID=89951 RepID=A0AA47MSB2_MERPO|nr:Centrosomal protein [Merluccius polli]